MGSENGRALWLRERCPHTPSESRNPKRGSTRPGERAQHRQAAAWRMWHYQDKRNGISMEVSSLRLSNEDVGAFCVLLDIVKTLPRS